MEQQRLNPTVVYVLAIIGLLCCCFGGLGIFLAGPAFLIAQNNLKKVAENPEDYDQSSVKAMSTAKTVALVILIINGIFLVYNIYDLASGGWEERQQIMDEIMKGFEEGSNQ
jgi:hypothetical protein